MGLGHSFKWVFVKKEPFPCHVMVHYMRFISIVLKTASPRGMFSHPVGQGWFLNSIWLLFFFFFFLLGLLIKIMEHKTSLFFCAVVTIPDGQGTWSTKTGGGTKCGARCLGHAYTGAVLGSRNPRLSSCWSRLLPLYSTGNTPDPEVYLLDRKEPFYLLKEIRHPVTWNWN